MSRTSLAYVAQISAIDDIEGKDRIKYVSLENLGWKVITNIADTGFKVGDKVIYVEYDTYIPAKTGADGTGPTPFEFLRKRSWSVKYDAFKVTAMKMAGVVSYGLIMNLKETLNFYKGVWVPAEMKITDVEDLPVGADLTAALGIQSADALKEKEAESFSTEVKLTKFQRFIKKYAFFLWKFFGPKKVDYSWPHGVGKTDETRIENFGPKLWQYLAANKPAVDITQKQDGQSGTLYTDGKDIYLMSRNQVKLKTSYRKPVIKAQACNHTKWLYDNSEILQRFKDLYIFERKRCPEDLDGIEVQFELCGPGIQKNPLGLDKFTPYVFNFVRTNRGREEYGNYEDVAESAKKLQIAPVPLIYSGAWKWDNQAALKAFAEGKYPTGGPREGIVIRANGRDLLQKPLEGMHRMFSFKCINDSYAIKND
jgi:hypothetical protein